MKKIIILFVITILISPIFISSVYAEGKEKTSADKKETAECNEKDGGCVNLKNPLGNTKEIPDIVSLLIQGALGVMGALVLIMFVWGGSLWLLSAGNQDKVKQGSQTMLWAVIGATIVLISYVMLDKILQVIGAV